MLPKLSLIYDRKRNRKVEACIYYAGKRRYLSTGVSLPDGATFRNGVISGCQTAPSLNKTLTAAMSTLHAQLQKQIEKDVFDISSFSISLKCNNNSFYDWASAKCDDAHVKESTKEENKKVLKRWQEQGIEQFSDLTPDKVGKAVKAFRERLRPTTTRLYVSHLNKHITLAIKEKLITENPLLNIDVPKGKSKDICYLTHEELEEVENLELTGKAAQARDMFLFSCYTGLAYSDLTKINAGDIVYIDKRPYIIDHRMKTGSNYRIRILPKALNILMRYDFNLALLKNTSANAQLKNLEDKLSFKKHISMHVGRHTFATLALSSGVRIETVSRMLAHADIKTTQIYAKVLQKDVDEGFDILEGKI